MKEYTYLILNIATIAYPIAQSFEHRLTYYKKWYRLFPAIFITGAFFIIWDILFTEMGVWSFNKEYLTGIELANLPIEEWLFFLTVPYACVFIYEVMNYFVKKDILGKYSKGISLFLAVLLITFALRNSDQIYTFLTFMMTAILLLVHVFILKSKYLGRFYIAYLVTMIPFAVVNGYLTSLPVVIYNDMENLSLRAGTIPVEDFIYNLLLLLMTITIYEVLKKKNAA